MKETTSKRPFAPITPDVDGVDSNAQLGPAAEVSRLCRSHRKIIQSILNGGFPDPKHHIAYLRLSSKDQAHVNRWVVFSTKEWLQNQGVRDLKNVAIQLNTVFSHLERLPDADGIRALQEGRFDMSIIVRFRLTRLDSVMNFYLKLRRGMKD